MRRYTDVLLSREIMHEPLWHVFASVSFMWLFVWMVSTRSRAFLFCSAGSFYDDTAAYDTDCLFSYGDDGRRVWSTLECPLVPIHHSMKSFTGDQPLHGSASTSMPHHR